ncbi:unnamed protein product, partial [Discosporangium mesarthrocarpum]
MQRRPAPRHTPLVGSCSGSHGERHRTTPTIGGLQRRNNSAVKIVLVSCASVALVFYAMSARFAGGGGYPLPTAHQEVPTNHGLVHPAGLMSAESVRESEMEDDHDPEMRSEFEAGSQGRDDGMEEEERVFSKLRAGWASISDEDLEPWAPLGPDPPGSLPRSHVPIKIYIAWGFGSDYFTLYSHRALESLLHVYPESTVRFITIGPRYALMYKWANVIAVTQFQKYKKRGYDVSVSMYFGGSMPQHLKLGGQWLPGKLWWERNKDKKLYANGMALGVFQNTADAVPEAYVSLYLAILELYKTGGVYADLTTFFVRPLPPGVDGFVAGGMGPTLSGR